MKQSLLSLVGILILTASGASSAERVGYGALAFNPKTFYNSLGGTYDTQKAANDAVERSCGDPDCKVVLEFHNSCAALAIGSQGYAWAENPDMNTAKANAVQECNKKSDTKDCFASNAYCTRK